MASLGSLRFLLEVSSGSNSVLLQNRAICRGRPSSAVFYRANSTDFDGGACKVRFPRVGRGEILVGPSLVGGEKGKKGPRAIGKDGSFEGEEGGDDGGINDGFQATVDKSEKVRAMQKVPTPLSLRKSPSCYVNIFVEGSELTSCWIHDAGVF